MTNSLHSGGDRGGGHRRRPRARLSVVAVAGEVMITFGVIALLYVGWQMWLGDVIFGAQGRAEASDIIERWQDEAPEAAPDVQPPPESATPGIPVDPVILPEPADTEDFAVMRVPRFGADYMWVIAGGMTTSGTLDNKRIGHYPGTQMPGDVGNFAVAAHRTTQGAPFNRLADLRVGDAIVIQAENGWYTYRFRTLEYVTPTEVDVLQAVPQHPNVPAGDRYITLTSCSPMFAMSERIVAYGVFEEYTPSASGPPASLDPPS